MFRSGCLLAGFFCGVALPGCSSKPKEEVIEIKAANDPLASARSVLKRYADGQPLASEVTSFPQMVEDVRKVAPDKAEILEKGLADIQKASAAGRAAKAKELLSKLASSGQ
jgi:hypothetical protein